MAIPHLSEAQIRERAAPESFERGKEYLHQGAVGALVQRGNVLEAEVEGSAPAPYRIRVTADAGGITEATCTCPYDWGGWCKHIVATLLAGLRQPEKVAERPPLEAILVSLDQEQLRRIVLHLVEREPRLTDIVEGHVALLTAAPAPAPEASASPAPRRSPVDVDAFRRQVRSIFRGLNGRYASESYWQTNGVVHEVQTVLEQAWAFVRAGDGHSALAILEAITEEYRAGYEFLDDSDGEGGELFREIGLAWAEAVLSADVTASERHQWAEKLAGWERELADYGVDDGFATALAAARQGWDDPQLQRILRGEWSRMDDEHRDAADDALEEAGDDLTVARLNVLERQGRFEEYLDLAEAADQAARHATMLVRLNRASEATTYGLQRLVTAAEALTLARALREHGEIDGALQVGERGFALEGRKAELAAWVRDLAAGTGQTARALTAARLAFREELSLTAFLRVHELAGGDWPAQRGELLEQLRRSRSSYLTGPVEIFLHEGLVDDAIAAVDAGGAYGMVERVVDAATASHPDWAIKTASAQAESIMDGGKAQHYDAAARWLEKARAAYRQAGREAEWRTYRQGLLERHQRKYKLRPLIEALR